jgi:signal transduction histidine kinase
LSSAASKAGRGDRTARIVETGATEIKDAARAFNAMQVDIEAFESERARTIAAVGHDLRTPITSLRIRTEMVEEGDLREPMIQTLDDMQVMADDLLAWGRVEAIKEETKEIDLSAMLSNVCNGTTVSYDNSAPQLYKCRPVALQRALTNLVENTERYAGDGIAKLVVEDKNVIITIEDDGPGIPAEQLKTIFKPFTRGEASRSKETGGHGLGLSIAESIIRSHGGTVILQNKTNTTGLIVTVNLPN